MRFEHVATLISCMADNLQDAFALNAKMTKSGLQLDLYIYTLFWANMNTMQEAREVTLEMIGNSIHVYNKTAYSSRISKTINRGIWRKHQGLNSCTRK